MGANRMGIYAIVNTVDGKVYVGSSLNIRIRLSRHRNQLKYGLHRNGHLQNAYNKHGADAFEYRVLEEVDDAGLLIAREQHWIDSLSACDRATGYNLIAIAEHRTHSPETREKMSASHIGRTFSPEHRARIGAANMGRKGKSWTAEQREKVIEALRTREYTPEMRAKMSAAQKGRPGKPHSPEARAKMSATRKGIPKSPEHRAKIGAAHRGKRLSPARRARLTEMHRNRSAETRARLSESNGKLTNDQVREIRRRAAEGDTAASLARAYRIAASSVSEVIRGVTYKHLL